MATTHLFWHPRYTYERTRQSGILVREVLRFRNLLAKDWPCIITGDFNFQPDDPAYSLLVGDPVLAAQEAELNESMVVHRTVDPSVPAFDALKAAEEKAKAADDQTNIAEDGTEAAEDEAKAGDDDDDGAATEPDRIPIKSARRAKEDGSDGLLIPDALREFYAKHCQPLKSAYDIGLAAHNSKQTGAATRTYGDRVALEGRRGASEPEWTSYAHFWKLVLDYIFLIDPPNRPSQVTGLLAPPSTADLEPSIPRLGKCSSDHVSLCAEVAWPASAAR